MSCMTIRQQVTPILCPDWVSSCGAGPLSSLPEHIAAQVAATKSHQVELMQQWQQQQQASQVYLQVLQQVLDSLMELIQDHLLGRQKVPTNHPSVYASCRENNEVSKE